MSMTVTADLVDHIAALSNIPVSKDEAVKRAQEFTSTLKVVESLNHVDTTGIDPTNQVTGLENVLRDDVRQPDRMFSQEEAIANAKRTYEGYIVVDQVIAE